LANTKSAKKCVKTIASKTLQNKRCKSTLKTSLKGFKEASLSGPQATDILSKTVKIVDKSCAKGIIHANKASRLKSKMQKAVNAAAGK